MGPEEPGVVMVKPKILDTTDVRFMTLQIAYGAMIPEELDEIILVPAPAILRDMEVLAASCTTH
jgi:hypothetical protein